MIIGADYEKMIWKFGEFTLMEPNTLITDTLMSAICFYLTYKLWKEQHRNPFVNWFMAFFLMLGMSTFVGGLGHGFYFYWGTMGKIPGWITAILAVFCIEQAMISFVYNKTLQKIYKGLSILKMLVVLGVFLRICLNSQVFEKPELGFLPIAINTILGTILSAGILGVVFYRKHQAPFHYFSFGVLAMLPAAFVFLMKINLHPWMDKNDVSHILLSIGNVFFYVGIIKVTPELTSKFNTEFEG